MTPGTRVYLSVSDAARRASLARALRTDPGVQIVASESDADVVVSDTQPARGSLATRRTADNELTAPIRKGETLTPRERSVLLLVAAGMGNTDIGAQLGISRSTVKYHLGAIFTKLGVHTRAEAVAMGMRSGIVLL